MAICCAVGCSNRSKDCKLYRLPQGKRNELRRKLWLIRIARDKWIPNENSRLCQAHFTEDQYENHRADNRRLLKQSAVPSIFSHRPPPKSRKPSKYVLLRDSSYSADFSMLDKNDDKDQVSNEAPESEDDLSKTVPGKEVTKRWKNIRDAFCKAEKREKEAQESGKPVKKKRGYIFSKELQFLKKTLPKAGTPDSTTVEEESREEADGSCQITPEKIECEVDLPIATRKKTVSIMQLRRKRKKMDEKDSKTVRRILENDVPERPTLQPSLENSALEKPTLQIAVGKVWSVKPNPQTTLENASSEKLSHQMSFFQSLLGHTESFDSNEWLQFQMEVLRTISNIKNQKAASLIPLTS